MNNGYQIRAQGSDFEILIYGDIGDWHEELSTSARQVVEQLQSNPDAPVTVRINSYGGALADGLAIHNALRNHRAPVTAKIEGVAYSVASMIPTAANRVEIADSAIYMVHAPWSMTIGNAVEMRKEAQTLDKHADAMQAAYMVRPNVDPVDINTMLNDGEDHYLSPAETVNRGFADAVIKSETSFSPELTAAWFRKSASKHQVKTMGTKTGENDPTTATGKTGDQVVKEHLEAYAAGEQAGIQKNMDRIKDIRGVFAGLIETDPQLAALATTCENDIACTKEIAQERILAYLRQRTDVPIRPFASTEGALQPPRREQLYMQHDSLDKLRAGAIKAIEIRAGIEKDRKVLDAERNNEMLSMSLLELGKHCMRAEGKRFGGNVMQVAAQICGAGGPGQGTDHFPAILENVLNKQLMAGYDGAQETWNQWTVEGRLNDFRPAPRVNKSLFDLLEKMQEFDKFPHGRFADVKEQIQGFLHGRAYSLSYQSLVDDDLNALVGTAEDWGVAAAKTIGNAVYLVLTAPGTGGYGQIMLEDNTVLFHANHNNLVDSGSGGDPDATRIGAMRTRMITQTDPNGQMVAEQPRYLLHSTVRTMAVRQLLNSQILITGENVTQGERNPVTTLSLEPVEEYRLDQFNNGTPWFILGGRRTIEVAFLNGQRVPMAMRMPAGEIPGITWQISLTFGVAALDWRTQQMDYGA